MGKNELDKLTKWWHKHDESYRKQTLYQLNRSKSPGIIWLGNHRLIRYSQGLKLPMKKWIDIKRVYEVKDINNIIISLFCYEYFHTVKASTNNQDPIYPPRMVFHCVDANHGRYNCIVENSITAKTDDKTNDTDVETAWKIPKNNN